MGTLLKLKIERYKKIMSFGKAVFKPKQKTDPHLHKDMDEIFFIISGKGLFHTNKESIKVQVDDQLYKLPIDMIEIARLVPLI